MHVQYASCQYRAERTIRAYSADVSASFGESGTASAAGASGDRTEFPPVLTSALAAELLQVHAETLRKMVREGRVPCHRVGGGRDLRFLRDELLAWVAAQPSTRVSSSASAARTAAH